MMPDQTTILESFYSRGIRRNGALIGRLPCIFWRPNLTILANFDI
jgi:hypothetical protein